MDEFVDHLTVKSLTLAGDSSGDAATVKGLASLEALVGGGGLPDYSSILVGDSSFDALSGIETTVDHDTLVNLTGTDLAWSVGTPSVVTVLTAGLYWVYAAVIAGTHPAVGLRQVNIISSNAQGGGVNSLFGSGQPAFPTVTDGAQFSHQVTTRLSPGDTLTMRFRQTSGDNWTGELAEMAVVRLA